MSDIYSIYEIYEYLGTERLLEENLSSDEADKFMKDNCDTTRGNVTEAHGAYVWYLEKRKQNE